LVEQKKRRKNPTRGPSEETCACGCKKPIPKTDKTDPDSIETLEAGYYLVYFEKGWRKGKILIGCLDKLKPLDQEGSYENNQL